MLGQKPCLLGSAAPKGPVGSRAARFRVTIRAVKCCLWFLAVCTVSSAGAQDVVQGYRVQRVPTIDGVVGSEEWAGVPGGTGGFDEKTGQPCPEATQFWVSYDDKFIYFAAKLGDRQAGSIRATERRRNVSLDGDDYVIFAIDPFGTLADLNQFEMNANGATNTKIAGGRAAKVEWQGEFMAKGRTTAEGWECEARIPWGIMRLPSAGKRTLRFTIGRVLQREQRGYTWNDISGGTVDSIGRWTDVEVPKSESGRTLKLLPFAYAGHGDDSGAIFNSGIDFKSSVTPEIELVGTVNPDFRNVENQVLSLDFSHFERLAGETRPFFREGAQYFQTSQDAPLFASQRIGSFDTGLKAYGRLSDRTTFAALATVDFGNRNAAVVNVTHSFASRTSGTVGGANLASDALSNQTTFFGFSHGVGPMSVFGQYMTSADTVLGEGSRFNSGLQYEGDGLEGVVEYTSIDQSFLPRLGFAPERGYRGVRGEFGYNRPSSRGSLMEAGFGVEVAELKAEGGGLHRRTLGAQSSLTFRDGTDVDFATQVERFGGFDNRIYYVSVERPRGNPYKHWQLDYGWGEISGASYQILSPSLGFRPIPFLQLNLSHQSVRHMGSLDQTILSANYELNVDESVSARLVRRGSDTNFYASFRRSGNRGAEYYVILGDPNAQTFRASVVLKVAVPFQIKY